MSAAVTFPGRKHTSDCLECAVLYVVTVIAQMKCSTRILIPYAHQVFLEFNFIYIATVLNNAHPIILERVAQTLVRKHLVKV